MTFKSISFLLIISIAVGCQPKEFSDNSNLSLTHVHQNYINGIAVSPDGQYLASVASDSHLKIFQTGSLKEHHSIHSDSDGLLDVVFASDGKTIAISNIRGGIEVYETESYRLVNNFQPHTDEVVSIAFSHDGQYLAAASKDGTITVTAISDAETVFTHEPDSSQGLPSFVAFTADRRFLLACVGRSVIVFAIEGWKEFNEFEVAADIAVTAMAVSPDGKLLATGTHVAIKLSQIPSGKEIRTLHGHYGRVSALAFSSNGRMLASGGGLQYYDSNVKLWRVTDGKELADIEAHTMPVSTLLFSPDSRWLYSGSWDEHLGVTEVSRALKD